MKVTGVRTKSYEIELTRPLGDANDPRGCTHLAMMAVYLDTDEGLTGIAMSGPGMEKTITGLVDSLIVGRDPRGVRGLWKRMVDQVFKGNNRGMVSGAISAIDIALWDIKGKRLDVPIYELMGGKTRDRVRCYMHVNGDTLDEDNETFYLNLSNFEKGIDPFAVKLYYSHPAESFTVSSNIDIFFLFSFESTQQTYLGLEEDEYIYTLFRPGFQFTLELDNFDGQNVTQKAVQL